MTGLRDQAEALLTRTTDARHITDPGILARLAPLYARPTRKAAPAIETPEAAEEARRAGGERPTAA